MSKTERDLAAADTADALDDLFADDEFDAAFDDAIEEAERDLSVTDGADDPAATTDDVTEDIWVTDTATSADVEIDEESRDDNEVTDHDAADLAVEEWIDEVRLSVVIDVRRVQASRSVRTRVEPLHETHGITDVALAIVVDVATQKDAATRRTRGHLDRRQGTP